MAQFESIIVTFREIETRRMCDRVEDNDPDFTIFLPKKAIGQGEESSIVEKADC